MRLGKLVYVSELVYFSITMVRYTRLRELFMDRNLFLDTWYLGILSKIPQKIKYPYLG